MPAQLGGSVVVGEFKLGVLGVAAKAQKGQRVLVFGVVGCAQQAHADDLGVEVDGALQVANAQHGVQNTHGVFAFSGVADGAIL